MKVTQNSAYRLMNTNLDRITNKLQDLHSQGATGLKLNEPSDDPSSIRPVLTVRTQIRHNERYLETMGVSLDKMQATDGHLGHVESILQRAKELAINAVNGALSDADREILADELAHLQSELLDAANATVDGKYIFAGYAENTKPFIVNSGYTTAGYDPANSTTWPVFYQGDANPTELEITPDERLEVTLTGNNLFLGISDANWAGAGLPATGQPEAGRADMFTVLKQTEEAIRSGDMGTVQNNIDLLETAADQNRRLRSRFGNRASRIEAAIANQEAVGVDLEQILSRYQDADAISTFNEIIKQETAFEAALNVTSRISRISILDFL